MARKDVTDKRVCEVYQKLEKEMSKFPYELLAKETGQPEKVCYRAMERASDHGLIEYGVSLRTGWLTEKGRNLINNV